jgi:ParB family chromosome partitioning protein
LEIVELPLSKLSPNQYNPNVIRPENMEKLRSEIKRKGMCAPLTVRASNGGYEIIDGYHRFVVLGELGYRTVPCVVLDVDDTEARLLTLQLNYLRGEPVPIKLADLIHDLNKDVDLSDLERMLPYNDRELKDLVELLKLPVGLEDELMRQAEEEAEKAPTIIHFILTKEQAVRIDQAVTLATELHEARAPRKGDALALICDRFIKEETNGEGTGEA